MRDLLTVLAGLIILVLVAALAVPPFIDWRGQRHYVDAVLSRAAGFDVRTDGAIEIRLLPIPRLTLERLRMGQASSHDASLDAQAVDTRIALTPLLSGEVRFMGSQVRRMEIKLPTGTGTNWRVPRSLLSDETLRRSWIFEDLAIGQLLLTNVDPRTGRTDQAYAERVQVQSQSLAGPWRAEGQVDSTRFTLVTGEIAPSGPTVLKLSTEGEGQPRVSLDARMFLERDGALLVPRFEGAARVVGPADIVAVPYTAAATFKTDGPAAVIDTLSVEAGEGGAPLRLSGSGRFDGGDRLLSVHLEGRRVDLDTLLAAYRDAPEERRRASRIQPPVPIEIGLKLDGLALAGEELAGVTGRVSLAQERLGIERLDFTAPGQTRVSASGEISLASGPAANGRVALSTRSADRLASYLARLGIADIGAEALAGRALEASGDLVASDTVVSVRNLQLRLGDATLTGAVRYTAPETSARGRVDAQIALRGLDLDVLPRLTGIFDAGRAMDFGLTLDARDVGYGAGERGGRISARLSSEDGGVAIDVLEIADLAGANASLRGRITPDGAGRIGGRLRARRADPLIALVGRASLGGIAEIVPRFLREAPLEAAVLVTSTPRNAGDPALVTKLSGTAGGGGLEAEATSVQGRISELRATLSTAEAGGWFGSADAARRIGPARLELAGKREGSGRLRLDLNGDVAGLRVATRESFGLSLDDDEVESGEAQLSTADLRPLLGRLGQDLAKPVDAEIRARLGRRQDMPRYELTGRVGESVVEADLSGPTPRDLSGRILLGRISLPWLLSSLALGAEGERPAASNAAWSSERFGPALDLPFGGRVTVRAATAELGRGLTADRAEFSLATTPDGIAIGDFGANVLGGRLTGSLTVARQGGRASLMGEGSTAGMSLSSLLGPPFSGRLSGTLRFGGAGESPAGIVASLGGAGTAELENLEIAAADPGAILRAVQRALRSDDTLVPARLQALASAELDRAPLKSTKAQGQATLVSGALRLSPLVAESDAATWQGSAGIDLRTLTLDVRGTLTARELPPKWSGAPPYLSLGWAGPVGRAARRIDVGPLTNGLASVVLARELDRIETFELDAAERMRLNSRVEMDRARRAAAEEAARLARQREEAERQRLEAERQRQEAERARLDAEHIMGGANRPHEAPATRSPVLAPPVEIRPPAQGGAPASGG
ncbi:AsmA family protein [Enterovirga sp. CN4-39]|uniref:AsmA family protein n=1 Tax=Enterovirga sp. CN4-39 TaxID=3400910 RepID=UPI003C08A415